MNCSVCNDCIDDTATRTIDDDDLGITFVVCYLCYDELDDQGRLDL